MTEEELKKKLVEEIGDKTVGLYRLAQRLKVTPSRIINMVNSMPEIYEDDKGKLGVRK